MFELHICSCFDGIQRKILASKVLFKFCKQMEVRRCQIRRICRVKLKFEMNLCRLVNASIKTWWNHTFVRNNCPWRFSFIFLEHTTLEGVIVCKFNDFSYRKEFHHVIIMEFHPRNWHHHLDSRQNCFLFLSVCSPGFFQTSPDRSEKLWAEWGFAQLKQPGDPPSRNLVNCKFIKNCSVCIYTRCS